MIEARRILIIIMRIVVVVRFIRSSNSLKIMGSINISRDSISRVGIRTISTIINNIIAVLLIIIEISIINNLARLIIITSIILYFGVIDVFTKV